MQKTLGNHRLQRLLQAKLTVSRPDDAYEQEAERVADEVMRMPEPAAAGANSGAANVAMRVQRLCDDCTNELSRAPSGEDEELIQAMPPEDETVLRQALDRDAEPGVSPRVEQSIHSLRGRGEPLSGPVRAFMEPRFGVDFSAVRLHTGGEAHALAHSVEAKAFTVGHDIVFANGHYADTETGKRLLAHELTHVAQQGAHRNFNVMRQPVPAQQTQAPLADVEEAAKFLEVMANFVAGARSQAFAAVQPTSATPPTDTARQHAHDILNQKQLRVWLGNARKTFSLQQPPLEQGHAHGTRLRAALLEVIANIREAAPEALAISDAMPTPTPADERKLNAELVLELIEADPFTSAGMVGTPAFAAAETAAGQSHEAFIEAYLDDLIRALPGQALAAADRDRILGQISAALRRSMLTVGTGPGGVPELRAITNPTIVDKYRRVIELLSAGMSARPAQLSIITDGLPAFTLPPDPVPDVTPQLQASTTIGPVDFSHVPAIELPYVRHGVLQAANTIFPASSTIQRRNASWPVALPVRRNGSVVSVRYDLIFDVASNVRVERLGEAAPREVPPAFAQLSILDKKTQLIADFGLAGVDDRPAVNASPGTPARPAAAWAAAELDQVKAAYDLIPAGDRAALRGVAIVRDHHGPSSTPGRILAGLAHTAADPTYDDPEPPLHAPPHIHYYDDAFDNNAITAVGAPGGTGPGADWTIVHEVGHQRINLASIEANAAITAANAKMAAANAGADVLGGSLPQGALHNARVAYLDARTKADTVIHALNTALNAKPSGTPAQRAALLQAAQGAVVARDTARANLVTAGVPAAMVTAATDLDAASDASLAATQSAGLAQDQIPTFLALAGTFGFTPFTDYARSAGDPDFFAETYALFLTDPDRLSAMNRKMLLWFEAGMPMNPAWRPPP